ncbi:hypothetical protein [Nitrobacter sp. JJSN]|uniref:hypothetical protein n=1 Tax=Nitrobacter sp. JJSN TaxID=3453033 RepID=UPI003F76F429
MSLLFLAPLVSGCSGASDMLSSAKDADWFSRSGRLFIKNVSIETPPLTPDKPVTPDDLISADGLCPGMAPPIGAGESSALADGAAGGPTTSTSVAPVTGTVALGHTECDVTRGIGAPDNVSLSNNPHGDRVAVLTFLKGSRAGIYTFTAGRLSSIERAPEPVAPAKPERRAKKKKGAAT